MSHFTHDHGGDKPLRESDKDYSRYTRSQQATLRAYDRFYSWFPSFLDVFPDEDAFLEFAIYFVVSTVVVVIVASRYITIKPSNFF